MKHKQPKIKKSFPYMETTFLFGSRDVVTDDNGRNNVMHLSRK